MFASMPWEQGREGNLKGFDEKRGSRRLETVKHDMENRR
jgi:hypothetical protein